MPPRTAAAAQPAQPPLAACVVAFGGKFTPWHHTQASLEALARALGARPVKSLTKDATHLVCTQAEHASPAGKAHAARRAGLAVVGPAWLLDCDKLKALVAVDDYLWDTAPAPAPDDAANGGRKRPSRGGGGGGNDDEPPAQKKQRRGAGTPEAGPGGEQAGTPKAVAHGQFVKQGRTVPRDEHCPLATFDVHVDPHSGLIYDASLNQSSASNNHNKFYRLQILREASTGTFKTWTRWGRVGEAGQSAALGNGAWLDALAQFEKKFRDKSGLAWDRRGDDPRPGKYAFVERSYDDDGGGDAAQTHGGDEAPAPALVPAPAPVCSLEKPVQELMELIFNQKYFDDTMASLNYDAARMPLGKLGKATILRGFRQLKDISDLIDDPSLAASRWHMSFPAAAERLSNGYYSLIPHAFGRSRPPVIATEPLLRREVELLESLSDMKAAADLVGLAAGRRGRDADADALHPQDRQFRSLGLDEMTPLDPDAPEFARLRDYLDGSRGDTHGHVPYRRVRNIFRLERRGEAARFSCAPASASASASASAATPSPDRALLWHGSRCANFGGILSQGLRIAPPEAPVSGYMFGKGIYLADMSSKSAAYCRADLSGGHALLLLCEADLGCPAQRLTCANSHAAQDAAAAGLRSTWGQGATSPSRWIDAAVVHESLRGVRMPDPTVKPSSANIPGVTLQYNEYICYDVAQVRMRYLFHIEM